MIEPQEIDALVEELGGGSIAWTNGRLEEDDVRLYHQDEAMTLVGPFGGEPLRGKTAWADRQARIVKAFTSGTGKCELISAMTGGDLAVIVLVERFDVTFAGEAAPQRWTLRTTQVFRKEQPGRWTRLHRHADPLIDFRPLPLTAALARGA
jgi:ketosteroid isomerase-like protein